MWYFIVCLILSAIFIGLHAQSVTYADKPAKVSKINKWRVIFGIILLCGVVFSVPLYVVTGFAIAEIFSNPDFIVVIIFLGYPAVYLFSIIASAIFMKLDKYTSALVCALLPSFNIIMFLSAWILFGIVHFIR